MPLDSALLLNQPIPFPAALQSLPDIAQHVDVEEVDQLLLVCGMDRNLAVELLAFDREIDKGLVPLVRHAAVGRAATGCAAADVPSVVGSGDWAFRHNHRYGTVVCDLERRRIVRLRRLPPG